ncbi:hypothetical protein DBR40_12990 [Pedobacter sp. KBW01]|uniref:hypothetical protein n=1 Tax=Pedobacter sp. KBW01 TaxID=2153364 RepID=UPI000F5ACBBB|nr:hypothetical protein [Pedobacter sp. KBW01]RQO73722.1 hypothetical protein DBR40_12990 [Pedobacter sp. KBW01]
MSDYVEYDEQTKVSNWRKFVRKNLLLHLIPNTILNTVVPYFAFKMQNSVHLFNGEQNLARFLLPMSALLPFMVTFDILKKIKELQHSEAINYKVDEKITGYSFILKKAGLNGLYSIAIVFAFMLALHFSFPPNHDFGITPSAVCAGLLAGLYSVTFFYLAIRKFKFEVM